MAMQCRKSARRCGEAHFEVKSVKKKRVVRSTFGRSDVVLREKGCILERQVFRFAEMILRDRCSTSYDLASVFRGRLSTLDKRSGKIAKRIGTRPSALHSTFHF